MNFLLAIILTLLSPAILLVYSIYALIYMAIFGSKAWDKKMDEESRKRREKNKR